MFSAITLLSIIIATIICVAPWRKKEWEALVSFIGYHRPKLDIIGKAGEVYLRRVWLLGHRTSKYALMIHQMNTPDQDQFPHDHPWNFLTLVLWGGYAEETPQGRRYLKAWSIHYRPATYIHRIIDLPRGQAFTLVLRWPYSRSWGFWTERGKWVYWKNFLRLENVKVRKYFHNGEFKVAVGEKEEVVSIKQYFATIENTL